MMTNIEVEVIDYGLQNVLVKYADIFAESKSLPPAIMFDQAIPLKSGAIPVSLRTSRYNFHQKNELKKQVKEMLSSEITT